MPPITTLHAPHRAHLAALIVCCALGALLLMPGLARAQAAAPSSTIVLVHGAWDKPAGWDGVAARLRAAGYPVVVPDNPLRSLSGDSAAIARFLHGVTGPIVLVGHSYGGMVITNAALHNPRVKALVYIAAFAPDKGETALGLIARSPGSLLPLALLPAPFIGPDHRVGIDTTINPLLFPTVFAQDAPSRAARQMAITQRPATLASGAGKSGIPAWRTIPSWYMVAHNDRIIPPAVERFMAQRAHAITVEIASSHAAPVAHPADVADLILTAGSPRVRRQRPPASTIAPSRMAAPA
jgi:pimeloyl-ACP methyl ester carboxylesterase